MEFNYDKWTEDEILEYTEDRGILVLFKVHPPNTEAEIVICGEFSEDTKMALKTAIVSTFANKHLTEELCEKINILARRWYEKFIATKPLYVLNFFEGKDERRD